MSANTPPARFANLPLLALDRKRVALLVGFALLTLALLLTLGGGREAITALAHVRWPLVLLALLIHYSGFAVRGLRWQQLLHSLGHRLSWSFVTTLLLAGWFVSALLPARAGDIMRVGVLHLPDQARQPVPVADALGSIVLERVLDLLAILVLGAGFGFVVLRTALPGWVLAAYAAGIAGLLLFGGTLLATPALLSWLRRWSSHKLWQTVLDFVAQLVASLGSLLRQPGVALLLLTESLYIWLCDALLMWLCVWSLGVLLPFGRAAFVALTVDVFAVVPLTPGGIGQIETVNAALLALLKLPGFNVAAAVLVNRAISYWSFLLFTGIVTFAAGLGQWLFARPQSFAQAGSETAPALGKS
ncbi:MAG: lysylphosphatidylglycerol synthase transmembrane domain-containing protein [Caldilineaceae bacterium]